MLRRLRLAASCVRAAAWAARAHRSTRAALRSRPLADVVVAAPPTLAAGAWRGVSATLRVRRATCLERALVLQRWLAAHGLDRDVVIGVSTPTAGFLAHAWLDGQPDVHDGRFRELTRMAP